MNLSSTLDLLLDLVYPRVCMVCEARIASQAMRAVCLSCLSQTEWKGLSLCRGCGLPSKEHAACPTCRDAGFSFDSVWSLGPYQGDLKQLIHAFKFLGDKGVGRDIADFMLKSGGLRSFLHGVQEDSGVLAVPMHRLKEKNRGYNQAKVLATSFVEATGLPSFDGALIKASSSVPQVELGRKDRWKNLLGTFALGYRGIVQRISGSAVILVDDVMTTGATAHHCAQLLKEAGAIQVHVVLIARSLAG